MIERETIPVPAWKRDILNTHVAFNILLSEIDARRNEIMADLQIGKTVDSALNSVKRHLPPYIHFQTETFNTKTLEKNSVSKLLVGFVPDETRRYYVPSTHQVFTIESLAYGRRTPPSCYPESSDFVGFRTLDRSRGSFIYHGGKGPESSTFPGVFVKDISNDPDNSARSGEKIISLQPDQAKALLSASREILKEKIGEEKTNQALEGAEGVLRDYELQISAFYEEAAPQMRSRVLNVRDAINRSRYRFGLPGIIELKRYGSDQDRSFFYFDVRSGTLIKSSQSAKRNFLRRITSVLDGSEATEREFVEKAWQVESDLTRVLPSGWALWDSPLSRQSI